MRWVEKLNLATGFILVIVGIINFAKEIYPAGFSWLIFGSMYLVMDSYQPINQEGRFERKATFVRKLFSLIGFIASAGLLVYTFLS